MFFVSATWNLFPNQKYLEHKAILKMQAQSIYWKGCLCSNIYLLSYRSRVGSVLPSTCLQPCPSVKAHFGKKRERQQGNGKLRLSDPENLRGENCPGWNHRYSASSVLSGWEDKTQGGKQTHSSNQSLDLWGQKSFPNTNITLGEWQSPF